MHILMTSLCKLSLNMQHRNDPKRRKSPRNETEIPGEYLSDVICHPSNERDVVVLKSDLIWGDISRSKDAVPNEGNDSKRRWSSDLVIRLCSYYTRLHSGPRRLPSPGVLQAQKYRIAYISSVRRNPWTDWKWSLYAHEGKKIPF